MGGMAAHWFYQYAVPFCGRAKTLVTLSNAEGESVLISPQQNTAQDISLFMPRELTVSQGDRVRFTRSDTDRGYVANSLWEVAGLLKTVLCVFVRATRKRLSIHKRPPKTAILTWPTR